MDELTEEHIYVGDEPGPMSYRLFEALEHATDIDFTEGLPLGYVIDLDAVDTLYANYDGDTRGDPPVVSFRYRGYQITIETNSEIRIVEEGDERSYS